jgi:hypothetical protein
MKTAMQELIDVMIHQRSISIDVNSGLSRPSDTIQERIETLSHAIGWAKSMLKIEKEQIEGSYIAGLSDRPVPFFSNYQAEKFYNETFNANEK